jgi:hypothetical protein
MSKVLVEKVLKQGQPNDRSPNDAIGNPPVVPLAMHKGHILYIHAVNEDDPTSAVVAQWRGVEGWRGQASTYSRDKMASVLHMIEADGGRAIDPQVFEPHLPLWMSGPADGILKGRMSNGPNSDRLSIEISMDEGDAMIQCHASSAEPIQAAILRDGEIVSISIADLAKIGADAPQPDL